MAADSNLARNDQGKEDEEDPVLSMVDYLREEEALEDDADAVLGDSDENQCTYSLGYRNRQGLYACGSCKTDDDVPAAICLGCSYSCHDGHDLYELYTKRNVRCDCGNKKFTDLICKLCPDKEDFNKDNRYNQNYKGVYCICSRPYPDPEDEIEDEMIQCVVCEDWFHGRHLGAQKPPKCFSEMICLSCMSKHEFLWTYTVHSYETTTVSPESSSKHVDVVQSEAEKKPGDTSAEVKNSEIPSKDKSETKEQKNENKKEEKERVKVETLVDALQQEENMMERNGKQVDVEQGSSCLLDDLRKRDTQPGNSATFWEEGYRSKFCSCKKCMEMYKDQNVLFLLDASDTVTAYETRGMDKKTQSTKQDQERKILQGMNHTQQIEMIQGFNDLKSALSDYLRHFAENGKVVREEDIREFFAQMHARKRQKTDHTPGYFCR